MSAGAIFGRILRRYGADALLLGEDDTPLSGVRVLLQTIDSRELQHLPTPLGTEETSLFLCLAQGDGFEKADGLSCEGKAYTIRNAHPVRVGKQVCHWRLILQARDGRRE